MNSQLEIKLAPTPESDKAKIAFTSLFANDDAYWIPYAIGKKLERERDEIHAQLREEQQLHIQTLNERDSLRFASSALKNAKGRFHTEQAAKKLFELLQ